ncbi:ABC transporter ATP-binding protein [Chromatiales bacterium (ex Bugula neritina AB1)]|nr:ABC transporter ATP-binding protein [Chromatiales bacterium (ex Bugula neritina AB1)]
MTTAVNNTQAVLRLEGISKRFGGFTAVDDVSFDLPAGAIGGLIGPNGAGKTTLFNTLAGMIQPDSGQVSLNGAPIHTLPPHRIFSAGLARTFQIPRPFREMTVLENVMTAPAGQAGEKFWNNLLRPGLVARQELALRDKAMSIIEFCDLARVSSDAAASLSGGQLKLLELARVLMSEPKLILLDEPAAGINPSLMVTLVDKITELNRQGYTFLIIEHNMDVVMSICEPIMVMAQGRLIYRGNAEDARQNTEVLDAYLGDLP